MEVSGQLHVLATLPLGKDHMYSLNRRLSVTQSMFEPFREERNILLRRGIESFPESFT
jgi:hypothetical protein